MTVIEWPWTYFSENPGGSAAVKRLIPGRSAGWQEAGGERMVGEDDPLVGLTSKRHPLIAFVRPNECVPNIRPVALILSRRSDGWGWLIPAELAAAAAVMAVTGGKSSDGEEPIDVSDLTDVIWTG